MQAYFGQNSAKNTLWGTKYSLWRAWDDQDELVLGRKE